MARALLEGVERSRSSAAERFWLERGVGRVAALGALSGCCGGDPEVVFLSGTGAEEAGWTTEVTAIATSGVRG